MGAWNSGQSGAPQRGETEGCNSPTTMNRRQAAEPSARECDDAQLLPLSRWRAQRAHLARARIFLLLRIKRLCLFFLRGHPRWNQHTANHNETDLMTLRMGRKVAKGVERCEKGERSIAACPVQNCKVRPPDEEAVAVTFVSSNVFEHAQTHFHFARMVCTRTGVCQTRRRTSR